MKKSELREMIREEIQALTEVTQSFVKYFNSFYGPKGLYPDKKNRTYTLKDINLAYISLLKHNPTYEWGDGDSVDRELVRDELIQMKKLDPTYNHK
jgi:hypothetical protein